MREVGMPVAPRTARPLRLRPPARRSTCSPLLHESICSGSASQCSAPHTSVLHTRRGGRCHSVEYRHSWVGPHAQQACKRAAPGVLGCPSATAAAGELRSAERSLRRCPVMTHELLLVLPVRLTRGPAAGPSSAEPLTTRARASTLDVVPPALVLPTVQSSTAPGSAQSAPAAQAHSALRRE